MVPHPKGIPIHRDRLPPSHNLRPERESINLPVAERAGDSDPTHEREPLADGLSQSKMPRINPPSHERCLQGSQRFTFYRNYS